MQAVNNLGVSSWSASWKFTTTDLGPATPILISPANNEVDISLSPTLSWNAALNATSYTLNVSTDAGFGSLVVNEANISSTSKSLTNLNSNTPYYWRVQGVNNLGISSWSAVRKFTTSDLGPAIPTLNSPANNAVNVSANPTLSWNAALNATTYTLNVSDDAGFSNLIVNQNNISATNYSVSNLNFLQTYYWRVKAVNTYGESAWSEIRNFKTSIQTQSPPILITPADFAPDAPLEFLFLWKRGPNSQSVNSFKFQYSESSDFSVNVQTFSGIKDTTFIVAGFSPLTKYYWRVKSFTNSDSSDWSIPFSFTTRLPGKNIYVDASLGSDNPQISDGTLLNPYKTITYAISKANGFNGDIIYVASGSYNEQVDVPIGLTIIGDQLPKVRYFNFNFNNQFNFNPLVTQIRNFEVTSLDIADPSEIVIFGSQNIILDNIFCTGFSSQNSRGNLNVTYSRNITIKNCELLNCNQGIYFYYCTNIELDNVKVHSNLLLYPVNNRGLYMAQCNNIVINNFTSRHYSTGVEFYCNSQASINNLTIDDSDLEGLILGACSYFTFDSGEISNNHLRGIYLDPANLCDPFNNQQSSTIDNLIFKGNYKIFNNGIGILMNPTGWTGRSINSPIFDGDFTFYSNGSQNNAPANADIVIVGTVSNPTFKGLNFIEPDVPSHPDAENSFAICVDNNNDIFDPIGVKINNCNFARLGNNYKAIRLRGSRNDVDAKNNNFPFASSLTDIQQNFIFDSSSDPQQPSILGKVDVSGAVYGDSLEAEISLVPMNTTMVNFYKGASYYLNVDIKARNKSYYYLKGAYKYDESQIEYLGYLSDGLINSKQWLNLSLTASSNGGFGYINFEGFGLNPINTDGTLFKLFIKVKSNAANSPATLSSEGTFLGNQSVVVTGNGVSLNFIDPTGPIQSKGDVTLDGIVTMEDFYALMFDLTGTVPLIDQQALINADFNTDTNIDQTDLNELYSFITGVPIVPPSVGAGKLDLAHTTISQNQEVIIPINFVNVNSLRSANVTIKFDPALMDYKYYTKNNGSDDKLVYCYQSQEGEAVIVLQSNGMINNEYSPGNVVLKFKNNVISNETIVSSSYSLNGKNVSNGPAISIGSGGITAVKDETEIPTEFNLNQNYPNPFNPTTRITYSLPENSFVSLKIYDMLGREIKTLVGNEVTAGSHSIEWNGTNKYGEKVASGTYIYRITAGSFISVKKMVLLK